MQRPAHADVASALHLHHVVSPDSMVSLNEPITVDEVVEILQALPRGKSADVQGLTCELFRLAVAFVSPHHPAQIRQIPSMYVHHWQNV